MKRIIKDEIETVRIHTHGRKMKDVNGTKPKPLNGAADENGNGVIELNKIYNLQRPQHFDIFVEEFNYWVNQYSLNNWEYHFNFGADGPDDNSRAHIYRDHPSRICLVFLNSIWEGTEPSEINIRHVAYHEATEMLLSKLNDLVNSRSVLKEELEEAIHVVIRTLENTHWQLDMEKRFKCQVAKKE